MIWCAASWPRPGSSPQRLELEITEGIILQNTEAVIETLTKLDQLGVCIAMDDFGTGYSSLSYLTRFPVKKIKIDRSFIDTLGTSQQTSAIVSSIVGLGQSSACDHHRRRRRDRRPGRHAEAMGLRPGSGLLLRQARNGHCGRQRNRAHAAEAPPRRLVDLALRRHRIADPVPLAIEVSRLRVGDLRARDFWRSGFPVAMTWPTWHASVLPSLVTTSVEPLAPSESQWKRRMVANGVVLPPSFASRHSSVSPVELNAARSASAAVWFAAPARRIRTCANPLPPRAPSMPP